MRPAARLLTIASALVLALALSLPASSGVPWVPAAAADTAHFTFEVEQRGDVRADFGAFADTAAAILSDNRGWPRAGVELDMVDSGGDFSLVLASPAEVDAAHEVCSPDWSCRVGDLVLINDVRWRQGTNAWTGTLAGYQQYLINHEVGHWLGMGHYDCPGAGQDAPVMQQQSISLQGCDPNSWPLQWEVEEVAQRQGTTPTDPGERAPDLPAVVRDRTWHLRESQSSGPADVSFTYGRAGDVPVAGDWNSDGNRTPGIVRSREWHLRNSYSGGSAQISFTYGRAGDLPVVGDWNGDGTDGPGIIRDGRVWHLRNNPSSGPANVSFTFGRVGDVPVVGDWNGDGQRTPGVFRDGRWHLQEDVSGGSADISFSYGRSGDVPIVGDWNGDGAETPGVIRGRTWHLRNALAAGGADTSFRYGASGDLPVIWR